MGDLSTLPQLFESQAALSPNHVAVVFENETLTYEQLNQKANQLAHYLIHQGVKPDTLVAIYLERSIDFLIAVMGILKAGGAYIPLDKSYPTERVSLILKGADFPLLITDSVNAKAFASHPGSVLVLSDNKDIDSQACDNPITEVRANNLAYVIYTSGSTGAPKGVLIEQASVLNYAKWFSTLYEPVQRLDFSSNPAFDMAITLYLIPMILGKTIVICKDIIKKDPRNYLNYLHNTGIDFIKLTPSYFKVLVSEAQNKPIKLPHLKKIMLGGENLSKSECEAWLKLYPSHVLYNEYGPTEATVAVAAFKVDKKTIKDASDTIPIGHLALNTEAYLLDKELKPVAKNEVGELYIGGKSLARGYLNSPELTQKAFIQNPFSKDKKARLYKTGDLCRLVAKNTYECLGRIDHQIKIRGFRVEPEEIETYLKAHPAIKAGAVIASLHQKEKSLVAYYILNNPKTPLETRELITYLKTYLPDYMIPSAFIRMDNFPLNANDKLDRNALPIPQPGTNQYYVPAKKRLEKKLVQLWSEELGITPLGIKDDFFELGGHSLAAARILSKLNHELKVSISLQELYTNPTIHALLPLLKNSKHSEKKHTHLTKKLTNDSALFPLADFQFLLWIIHTFEPSAQHLNVFTRKRIQGRLNLKRLNKALTLLVQKHEALSYHAATFKPGQYLIKSKPLAITEMSLKALSDDKKEAILEDSLQELILYKSWPKKAPQILIRFFNLNDKYSELQLCVPHILSDDLSPEILMTDLSHFYQSQQRVRKKQHPDSAYRHYLLEEQHYFKKHLDKDITFWEEYLKDAYLCAFPQDLIIKNMKEKQTPYSTYLPISEKALATLKAFCAKNRVSILDGLSAVVVLAIKNCAPLNEGKTLCVNRVKSTREKPEYDNTVGCFLRIESTKLTLKKHATLSSISHDIHQSTIETQPYQACPNLVKLASVGTFRKEKNTLKSSLAKMVFWVYSALFQARQYYQSLRVLERLNTPRDNNFLININVQTNFFTTSLSQEEQLFGYTSKELPVYQHNLVEVDNLFDVNFLRGSNASHPYLVLSANLKPDFREALGQEMIRIMKEESAPTIQGRLECTETTHK